MSASLPSLATLRARLGPAWAAAACLMRAAAVAQVPLYLVGGPVRDLLAGKPVRDVDFVALGSAARLVDAVVAAHGGHSKQAARFGTASWYPAVAAGEAALRLDVATARQEIYPAPAALPQVTAADLAADLGRRDFSINAMALHWPGGRPELIDPSGGAAHLAAGELHVLHRRSFWDDPTRLLRAARFAARDNLRLGPATAEALRRARAGHALGRLSAERRAGELDRLLGEARPLAGLATLAAWGLTAPLLGGHLDAPATARLRALAAAHARLGASAPPLQALLWQALPLCLSGPAASRRRRFAQLGHRGRAALQAAPALRAAHRALLRAPASAAALWPLDLAQLAVLSVLDLPAAAQACVWDWLERGRLRRPSVDGAALQARGFVAGPPFGPALRAAAQVARQGGDAAAQWAAALALLPPPPR